jgi:hypothetical protein
MTMTLEDRLRDAYQAAALTVQPDTIRPGVQHHRAPASRSHRRFGIFAPIAAAAAVVAVAAAAVTVPNLVAGHRTPVAVTTPAATRTPPFLLEVTGAPGGGKLAVQQAGTRHVTALLSPPQDGLYTWDAVAAVGGTTFIAAATDFRDHAFTSALFRLTLSASGKVSQFTQLSSGIPGEITAVAASQDSDRIAYTAVPENGKEATIAVVTGTTTRRYYVALAGGPGSTGLEPGSLSLSADGSDLGFIFFRIADTVGPVRAAGTTWLLPADFAPGNRAEQGHKVTTGPADTAPFSAVLSPDGQTMYVLSMAAQVPGSAAADHAPTTVTLSAYSTAEGTPLRTLHTWTSAPGHTTAEPGMTISGSQLLVWGVDGTAAYQVNPASGATKPVWVYSLQEPNVASAGIAW